MGRDAGGVFGKARELGEVAPRHVREAGRKARQHRIEKILRAAFALLWALRRRLLLTRRGERLPAEFVAVDEARDPGVVLRVIAVVAGFLHGTHDAPAPAELHGADMDDVHLRLGDTAVGLLDQRAGHAAPAEVAREREPDRAGADN